MKLRFWRKLVLFSAIYLFLLSGCSNELNKYTYSNYKTLKKPSNKIKLNSTVVLNKNDYNRMSKFTIINKYMFLIDSKADKFIKIFNLKTFKFLKSFGKRGQGPSDFVSPSQIIPSPKSKNIFWIYDISTRKLKKFNLNKILNSNSIVNPEKIISIKEGNGIPNQLIITSDNKIFGIGFFIKGRISIFNMNGDLLRSVGENPVVLKNERFAFQHSHGFSSRFILRNKSNEIYLATFLGDIVEKYSIEGKLISTLRGPELFFPKYSIVRAGDFYTITYNKDTRFGYRDICYNKKLDKIFLLYSGKYFLKKKNLKTNLYSTIYVLNPTGKIIEEIELDKEIFRMKITEDGSTIFGITVKEDELIKYKYNEQTNIGINFQGKNIIKGGVNE